MTNGKQGLSRNSASASAEKAWWWPDIYALSAIALVVCAALTALLRLDTSWDSLAYHLPFAAIRGGLVHYYDYVVPAHHQEMLRGFPPVIDTIKGLAWRATGRVETTQLFNIAFLVLLCWAVHRQFKIGKAFFVLCVFALPAAHIEMAGNYTDVPVNLLLAVALFGVVHSLVWPSEHTRMHSLFVLGCICAATFCKVTAIPVGFLIWSLYCATHFLWIGSTGDGSWIGVLRASSLTKFIAFAFFGLIVSMGFGWFNIINFGNPFFPVPLNIGPIHLPGIVPTSNWDVAEYVKDVPRPLRWMLSVTEWRAFDGRPVPYIPSQGDVPNSSHAYRMGGLFFMTLMISVGLCWKGINNSRARTLLLGVPLLFGVLISFIPGSHEMRYFFFWYLAGLWGVGYALRREDKGYFGIYEMILMSTIAYLVLITGARYVLPVGQQSAREIIGGSISSEIKMGLIKNQRFFCLSAKQPYTFLYSDIFHVELEKYGAYTVSANDDIPQCSTSIH